MVEQETIVADYVDELFNAQGIDYSLARTAGDVMNPDYKSLTLDHTIEQSVKFMKNRRVRHAPILDAPRNGEATPFFVGVISQRDVLRVRKTDPDNPLRYVKDDRALRQLLVQIVTRNPKSAAPETGLDQAICIMLEHHVDMLPILQADRLVGIITTIDLLKALIKLGDAVRQLPAEQAASHKALASACPVVRRIMTEKVVTLGPQAELADAIRAMQQNEFRHIPVTDDSGRLLGLVSDRDVLRQLPFPGRRPARFGGRFREYLFKTKPHYIHLKTPLEEMMTRKVTTVAPDCSLCDAAEILYDIRTGALPVIEQDKKLCGIVTVHDLMVAMLKFHEPMEPDKQPQMSEAH